MIFSCVKDCESSSGARCQFMWGGAKEAGDNICSRYARPYAKWHKMGGCEGATHIERAKTDAAKVRVGQQKQKTKK